MKFYLRDIQYLDIILKRLISANNLDIDLKLVIKYNNSLYSGDFVNLSSVYILNSYIDEDGIIDFNKESINKLLKFPENFWTNDLFGISEYKKYSNVIKENNKILLKSLVDILKSCELVKTLDYEPIMFNIKSLSDETNIPYLYLDKLTEYELVSIVER